MCGIGGVLMKNGAAPDGVALIEMQKALGKRGPDGVGSYTSGAVGLVHTRLAIIDPVGGHQPLIDAKGRAIVFNGEIYNYIEIKRALSAGYDFKTNSDTETILALYDKYGLDFVNHLRGMYAFALYDAALGRLILARDPFGIKPLYVCETLQFLAFASEPKALFHGGFAATDIDMKVLRQVLAQNYSQGAYTVYPDVERLPAGAMVVYEDGVRVSCTYRASVSSLRPQEIDEDVALAQLDSILDDTVRVHCRSDVGYGVFLSGGVDSSTIMKVLANQTLGSERIKSYTAYFDVDGAAKDERAYARAVAESCFADYHEVAVGADDFRTLLPHIAAYMDDPVADYAILPTWKLASVAAKDQKVILCGEGGDELFAGYGRYHPRWWKDWRNAFAPSLAVMSPDWTRLQRAQAADIANYLPNDLLIKLDTCLMAHGLEGRTPFLDSEVAAFAFSLPDSLKLREKNGKYLLKTWLQQNMPEAQPFRKKQGFTVPVGHWMAEDAAVLSATLMGNVFVKNLLTSSELSSLPARLSDPKTAKECWSLLYLALWHMGKITDSPAHNIADALAA